MNKFITFFLLTATVATVKAEAAAVEPASTLELSRVCADGIHENCLSWYTREGFSQSDFTLTAPEKGGAFSSHYRPVESFPVLPGSIFDSPGSHATWSLVTWFDLPASLPAHRQPGIAFSKVGEVFEIYINGHLIARDGRMNESGVSLHRSVRSVVYQVGRSRLKEKNNQLLIKISGDPRYDETGLALSEGYTFGDFEALKEDRSGVLAMALTALYLFVGLYHLLLMVKRPRDRHNLYFGLFGVFLFVYLAVRSPLVSALGWDTGLLFRIELTMLYLNMPLISSFMELIFIGRVSRFNHALFIYSGLLIIPTLILPLYLVVDLLRLWQLSIPLYFLPLIIVRMVQGIKSGNRDARRLVVGFTVFVVAGLFDIVDSALLNWGIGLMGYGFSLFVFGIAAILANRFMRVHNEVEELNSSLEKKVKSRTLKLQQSLNEVTALKEQQDGDYFLTSQLIKPLNMNRASGTSIAVDILVKQKKSFSFRKWQAEIGGDLCIADSIELKGRRYTVVLNGDAMGKSIQGAGGAVVLGTVFQSIVNRTAVSSTAGNRHPEQWLRDCFNDLQQTFMTFDGSMLVSAVLGLVDEESGLFYYINAEHPWVVLLRDGRASFIEKDLMLRKFGVNGPESRLHIKTFQMKYNDCLILGSDGRDDLVVAENESGRVINEDETQFLKRVEESAGNLAELESALEQYGSLSDDLSLMRISCRVKPIDPEPPVDTEAARVVTHAQSAFKKRDYNLSRRLYKSVLQQYPGSITSLKGLSRIYCLARRYESACDYALAAHQAAPEDAALLHQLSQCLAGAGRVREAIDYGERCRLRLPSFSAVRVHLAGLYYTEGLTERAALIIDEALEVDPSDRAALELKEKISQPQIEREMAVT